jgi:hypothetical protein
MEGEGTMRASVTMREVEQVAHELGGRYSLALVADALDFPYEEQNHNTGLTAKLAVVHGFSQAFYQRAGDEYAHENILIRWEKEAVACSETLTTLEQMMTAYQLYPPGGQAAAGLMVRMLESCDSIQKVRAVLGIEIHNTYAMLLACQKVLQIIRAKAKGS